MSDDYASAGKSFKVWVWADVDVAVRDVGVYESVCSAVEKVYDAMYDWVGAW